MRLAGTYHPVPYILERISEILPGISDVQALWMGNDRQLYTSHEKSALSGQQKIEAQALRNTRKTMEWTDDSSLFTKVNTFPKQQTFDDENNLHVLRFYFPSAVDSLKDILIIDFPSALHLKQLDLTFNGISTSEKQLLGNFLSTLLFAEYNRANNERTFLLELEKQQKQLNAKIETLTHSLHSTEQLYSSSLRMIVEEYVSQVENDLNIQILVDDEVIFTLAKAQLSIHAIKNTLHKSIQLAHTLNISSKTIHITSSFLLQESFSVTKTAKQSKELKIKSLLDSYEKAAQSLNFQNMAINAKNIAAHLSPPVTPPAITDAVKKNKSKIQFLFHQYPVEWKLIKQYIRPLSKLDAALPFSKTGT